MWVSVGYQILWLCVDSSGDTWQMIRQRMEAIDHTFCDRVVTVVVDKDSNLTSIIPQVFP